ncbi:MAG: U32 family peptidase [Methanobacteriaceae archaeon]|nr:U32 family peptidase [Methanobacteriaceae archaeon]MDP2836394.1 U32 family peptidase [Methanobacteriaceae archaeon]MDP3035563.1 U32 family peptidase [Methanobacteriaceae archaeon]MDP3484339.1 U32 family peptidase [Methanobacteriaceae archaeon]
MVELLAPAKDFKALTAALKNGANSIYVGIEGCNMRANVSNFTLETLKNAVKQCHDLDKKIYVCTNTIMKNKDINYFKNILPVIHSYEVDALIISDLGALKLARDESIDTHMSIQANISNFESLNLLEELGVSRVVLSRELSLLDIKEIKENTNLEIETFIHGAMCVAVSGRCFLSSHLYHKSANCGDCLQPCRKKWKLVSEDDDSVSLVQTENESHILSPKDLCMIKHIPELMETGIDAFKIEGRARPADYVATVTKTYREAIDSYESGNWKFHESWADELKKVFNRGFDTGFYFRNPYKTSIDNESSYIKKDIGLVVNYYKNVSAAEIRLFHDLKIGDEIIIQGNKTGSITQRVESMQIDGKNIKEAKKGQNVGLMVKDQVRPNDIVYKMILRK